ncbi:MAG: NADPH-dependent FMN reductase [Ectothiorhodospiraceae bacterium]|jgi:NAD(P)H-dependent FMN reductase
MTTIVGIAGSLRRGSFNAALLRAATELAPDGVSIETVSIAGVPLYNADVEEAEGVPAEVETIKARIRAADGLLLVSPEYNNSIPGVLKNAVDWLSRPPADVPSVFGGRPVGVIGASPGGFGTVLAQNAWLPVLRTLRTRPYFGGRVMVSRAGRVFDDEGGLTDSQVRDQLRQYVEGFAAFVESGGPDS